MFGNKLSLQSDWPHSQGRGSSKSANTQHTHTCVHKHGRARFQTHLTKKCSLFCLHSQLLLHSKTHTHVAYLRTCTVQRHRATDTHTHNTCTVQMQANTLHVTHGVGVLCVCAEREKEANGKANSFFVNIIPTVVLMSLMEWLRFNCRRLLGDW